MRALTIALCLLATPALADVAGIPNVIDAPESGNYAAGTASPGSVANMRPTRSQTRSPAGP